AGAGERLRILRRSWRPSSPRARPTHPSRCAGAPSTTSRSASRSTSTSPSRSGSRRTTPRRSWWTRRPSAAADDRSAGAVEVAGRKTGPHGSARRDGRRRARALACLLGRPLHLRLGPGLGGAPGLRSGRPGLGALLRPGRPGLARRAALRPRGSRLRHLAPVARRRHEVTRATVLQRRDRVTLDPATEPVGSRDLHPAVAPTHPPPPPPPHPP